MAFVVPEAESLEGRCGQAPGFAPIQQEREDAASVNFYFGPFPSASAEPKKLSQRKKKRPPDSVFYIVMVREVAVKKSPRDFVELAFPLHTSTRSEMSLSYSSSLAWK